MSLNNSVRLIGNLGNDPELRYTANGSAVCNFRVATNDKFNGKEYTEWHRVTVWGKTAEACAKYLTKGRQVILDGSLRTRQWEDRDGNKRYTTEVHARQVNFGARPSGQQQEEQSVAPQAELDLPEAQLMASEQAPF